MAAIYVRNQREFDAAVADVAATDKTVVNGSATVQARGTITVWACGATTVQAHDTVTARAYGSATVEAHDLATVWAYDSATVWAYDSATVWAYAEATVRAHGSATVFVESRDASVEPHSSNVRIVDATAGAGWIEAHGVEVHDGEVILYKATGGDLTAGSEYGRPTRYAVGSTVVAEDWNEAPRCGEGLHVSPTAAQARSYRREPSRYLRVATPADGIVPLGRDKCKVRTLRVLCEVDIKGNPLTQ